MIEFGSPCLPLKKGLSPDVKIPSFPWFGQLLQQPGNPPHFCPIWSQIKLPAVHRGHFGGLFVTLGQSALQRQTIDPATGFCTLSWLQVHTILDSEENPLLHKQGRLASKEPRFEPLGLLHLVRLGE